MVKFSDISEYYVNDLGIKEEQAWTEAKQYKTYVEAVKKVITDRDVKNILEIGCGTGFVPTGLPDNVGYMGIDKNPTFIKWAIEKNNPTRQFVLEDIRNVTPEWLQIKQFVPDVVVCFAVLKHFSLDEWNAITTRILSLAPLAILEMQIGTDDLDNGSRFHHVFVTPEHMEMVLDSSGHVPLYEEVIFDSGHDSYFQFQSKIIVSQKT